MGNSNQSPHDIDDTGLTISERNLLSKLGQIKKKRPIITLIIEDEGIKYTKVNEANNMTIEITLDYLKELNNECYDQIYCDMSSRLINSILNK